jgi:hypothetical protein
MVALICFVLAVLALPIKSKNRLEAENAVLRHQLITKILPTPRSFSLICHKSPSRRELLFVAFRAPG